MSLIPNSHFKNIWTAFSNIFVFACCVLAFGAMIKFSMFFFTAPEEVKWSETTLTGTVLGSHNTPSQYQAPKTYIRVKLASGETVLVHDKGTLPLITKGQQVQLNQGTVDSEQVFYRFASPSQEELK